MKKRIASIILSLVMLLSLLPTVALAGETAPFTANGCTITDNPYTYTLSCEDFDFKFVFKSVTAGSIVYGQEYTSTDIKLEESGAEYKSDEPVTSPFTDAAITVYKDKNGKIHVSARCEVDGGTLEVTYVEPGYTITIDSWKSLQTAITAAGTTATTIQLSQNLTALTTDAALTIGKDQDITLDLNGYVLNRGLIAADGTKTNNDHGSAVEVIGGTLTIIDSNTDKQTHRFNKLDSGLWVRDETNGTVTITGGCITGGVGYKHYSKTNTMGGGVYVNGGSLTMRGGNICGNTAAEGGGVYGNNVTLTGGVISGNAATASSGGVYGSPLKLGGTIVIKGNVCNGSANNACTGTNYIDADTVTPTASVGMCVGISSAPSISTKGIGQLSTQNKEVEKYFFADASDKFIEFKDNGQYTTSMQLKNIPAGSYKISVVPCENGTVYTYKEVAASGETISMSVVPAPGYTLTNGSLKVNNGAVTVTNGQFTMPAEAVTITAAFEKADTVEIPSWLALQGAIMNAGTTATTIKLTRDLTAWPEDSHLTVAGGQNITLDLNGYVLDRGLIAADGTAASNNSGSVIMVDGALTITDSNAGKQTHRFKKLNSGLWVRDEVSGTMTITGGCITGGVGYSTNGGGVYVLMSGGSCTMNAGTIVGNTAAKGGGVYSAGAFTLNGGAICGNTATAGGGGAMNYHKMTVAGGSIHDNISSTFGGGLAFDPSGSGLSMTITGGSICNNTATTYGGGVMHNYGSGKPLRIGGTAVIRNNKLANGTDDNLFICENKNVYAVSTANGDAADCPPADGMCVYLTTQTLPKNMDDSVYTGGISFTSNDNFKSGDLKYFYTDLEGYYIAYEPVYYHALAMMKLSGANHKISIAPCENGIVYADKQACGSTEGSNTVTLTVIPDVDYELGEDGLQVSGGGSTIDVTKINDTTYTFPMPAANVTVNAAFEPVGPSIKVKPAANKSNPVFKTAYNDTLFEVETKNFETTPSLTLQWKGDGDAWNGTAPNGVVLGTDGTLTTTTDTPAGNYVFRIITGTEGQGDFVSSGPITLTVEKAPGSASVSMTGWTYGGAANDPSPTSSTNGTTSVTYQYKVSTAGDDTYSNDKPTSAGTYTVKATFAATANYAETTATANFTIAKATPTAELLNVILPTPLAYSGSDKTATAEAKSGITGLGTPTVTYEKDNAVVTETKDVGTYKVYVSLAEGDNYAAASGLTVDTWTFTITKINYADSYSAAANAVASGNLKAKLNETVEIDLPGIPDGASYGTVTNENTGLYTVNDANKANGKLTLTAAKNFDEKTESGETTFTVAVTPDGNHNGYTITVTVTPVFKTEVTVSGVSMVYPNEQSNFIYGDTVNHTETPSAKTQDETPATVTISSWTYTYYEKTSSPESPWLQLNGAPTDAGSYKLVVAANDEDYEGEQEITFTIAKRPVALVWPEDDFTYSGENQAESLLPYFVDDLDGNKQVKVSGSDLNVKKAKTKPALQGTSGPDFRNAGNYTAGIRSFEHSDAKYKNYAPTEATQSTTYTMKPKALTAAVTATKVYDATTDATAAQVTATVETGIGTETLTISGVTGTFNSANVTDCESVTPVGTNMTVTAGEGTNAANYEVSLPESGTGSITAFNLNNATVTLTTTEYAYTDDEIKPTPTVTFDAEGKNAIPAADYEVSYTNNTNTAASTLQTGAPTVTVTAKTGNVTNSKSVNFTITKAATPPTGTPTRYTASVTSATSASLSDMGITLDGATIKDVSVAVTETTYVITGVPTVADDKLSISWVAQGKPSTENNDVYTLTIESTNYADFTVVVTFAGKTAVTFPAAADFKFGGGGLVYGIDYDVTPPTVSVGGEALSPQPTMTYTYYRNTGSVSTPVWTILNPNVKPTDAGSYKVEIAVDDETYTGSQTYEFTIAKATQNAPAANTGFSIDYKAETLTASGDTYEVSSTNGNTVTALENNVVTPGGTYYVRLKGDDNHEPSPWTKISVSARPGAVSGVIFHPESIENKNDAYLDGVGSTMEYCTSVDNAEYGAWLQGDGATIDFSFESVSRYEVKVRYKATNNAFASAETTYTFVPSGTKYTVTLGDTTKEAAYGGTIEKPDPDPTQEGFTFGGWYSDPAFTQAWNFDLDTVTGNMTLYPKWIENTVPNTVVTGMVKEGTEGTEPVPGARVELFLGTTKVATTTTDEGGAYTFDYVENGTYNIVVTKNPDKPVAEQKKMTAMVTVDTTGTTYEVPEVVLPTSDVSSEVKHDGIAVEGAKSDIKKTVVGGLDEIAEKAAGEGKVTVKLTVEPKLYEGTQTQDEIKREAGSGKQVEFLNLTLTKHINDNDDGDDIGGSNEQLLTIIFPFDFTGVNVSSVTALRYHDQAEAMTRNPADNAEGFTVNEQAGTITIQAYQFSEYAIAYSEQSSGGNGGGSGSSSYAVTASSTKNGTISVDKKNASAGQTVTITVTPDKGFTLETLTVLDKNGKEVEIKNLGNNKYSFKMPSGKVSISATFMEDNSMLNFFVDVKATSYYYDAVLWAAENGITKGTDAVHFSPKAPVTRAQVVTFLWRAAGKPVVNYAMSFADVSGDAYYTEAVRWAVANGITKGTTATTFDPNGVCTRGHIVTFLYRYAKASPVSIENPFADVAPGRFYYKAALWADANDITHGRTKTTFAPKDPCTRAQVVTFLYRYMVK